MFDFGNTDYTRIYIKRQEELLLDQIKKSIDLDVKVMMLSAILDEMRKEYNEVQSQLQQQIDISNQAANGLQDLTNQNKLLEDTINQLKENIEIITKSHEIEIEIVKNELANSNRKMGEIIVGKEKVSSDLEFCLKKTDGLERELVRQQKEMQEIFEENKNLQTKKTINKKKTVDDSDF